MTAFEPEGFDVGPGGFGDPEAVEGEQGDQGVLDRRSEPGCHEQGADLVAVQADGVGLVVQAWPADVHRRGDGDETLFFGVAVEAGHRAQPPGHRRPGQPASFQAAGVAFDVGSAGGEQAQLLVVAPGDELAQIERVGIASGASIAGQEADKSDTLLVAEFGVEYDQRGGWC